MAEFHGSEPDIVAPEASSLTTEQDVKINPSELTAEAGSTGNVTSAGGEIVIPEKSVSPLPTSASSKKRKRRIRHRRNKRTHPSSNSAGEQQQHSQAIGDEGEDDSYSSSALGTNDDERDDDETETSSELECGRNHVPLEKLEVETVGVTKIKSGIDGIEDIEEPEPEVNVNFSISGPIVQVDADIVSSLQFPRDPWNSQRQKVSKELQESPIANVEVIVVDQTPPPEPEPASESEIKNDAGNYYPRNDAAFGPVSAVFDAKIVQDEDDVFGGLEQVVDSNNVQEEKEEEEEGVQENTPPKFSNYHEIKSFWNDTTSTEIEEQDPPPLPPTKILPTWCSEEPARWTLPLPGRIPESFCFGSESDFEDAFTPKDGTMDDTNIVEQGAVEEPISPAHFDVNVIVETPSDSEVIKQSSKVELLDDKDVAIVISPIEEEPNLVEAEEVAEINNNPIISVISEMQFPPPLPTQPPPTSDQENNDNLDEDLDLGLCYEEEIDVTTIPRNVTPSQEELEYAQKLEEQFEDVTPLREIQSKCDNNNDDTLFDVSSFLKSPPDLHPQTQEEQTDEDQPGRQGNAIIMPSESETEILPSESESEQVCCSAFRRGGRSKAKKYGVGQGGAPSLKERSASLKQRISNVLFKFSG